MKKINQKGFTLIELLVVIAIIGILSSIVLVSLNSARVKARDAKRQADMQAVNTAQVLFADSQANGFRYVAEPAAACALTGWTPTPSTKCPNMTDGDSLTTEFQDYLQTPPADPGTTTYYYSNSADANASTYCVAADLESGGSFTCTSGGCSATAGAASACTEG